MQNLGPLLKVKLLACYIQDPTINSKGLFGYKGRFLSCAVFPWILLGYQTIPSNQNATWNQWQFSDEPETKIAL